MGAGKTTLGEALAERLPGWSYIDLDHEIERRAGMSVSRIFAELGEERFRQMERQLLSETSRLTDIIVSCGGGTPCFFDNMELMNRHGLTVWLQAPAEVLVRRLLEAQAQRPKLNGMSPAEVAATVDRMMEERTPAYSRALHRFPSVLLENADEIDHSSALFISRFISPANQS